MSDKRYPSPDELSALLVGAIELEHRYLKARNDAEDARREARSAWEKAYYKLVNFADFVNSLPPDDVEHSQFAHSDLMRLLAQEKSKLPQPESVEEDAFTAEGLRAAKAFGRRD